MDAAGTAECERRKRWRFAIRRELRYKLMEGNVELAHGTGETVNMSSGGIWFTAGRLLKPGALLELSISWPVLLGENTLLRLLLIGRVVRSSGDAAACTVDKYELRTQARSAGSPVLGRRDSMPERPVLEVGLRATAAARECRA